MIFFMLPLLAVSVTQIDISSKHKIVGVPIRAFSTVSKDYVGFTKDDFIKLKSSIVTNKSLCDIVLDEAKETCTQSIEQCFNTCNMQPENELVIKVLKQDLISTQTLLKKEQNKSTLFKYVSIGLASIALSSSVYIIAK